MSLEDGKASMLITLGPDHQYRPLGTEHYLSSEIVQKEPIEARSGMGADDQEIVTPFLGLSEDLIHHQPSSYLHLPCYP